MKRSAGSLKRIGCILVLLALILCAACGRREAPAGTQTPAQTQEPEQPQEADTKPGGQETPGENAQPDGTDTETGADTQPETERVTESETLPQAVYTPDDKTVYSTTTLNVRAGDSTDTEKLGKFTRGQKVHQLAVGDNGWVRIEYKGQTAYVSGQYLSETEPETEAYAPAGRDVVIHGSGNGQLIVIDPGHQRHANKEQEPIGPGASETKKKVTAGTTGAGTGIEESEMVLQVGLKLRDALVSAGYRVIMVRESQDVDLSNVERAKIANDNHADAFLRLHGNATDSSSVRGANPIIMTKKNPYNASLHDASYRLAQCVIEEYCDATGIKNRGVKEADTYSGINWSEVPVILFEMGFMSNPDEDRLLNDPSFQDRMVKGIVNGLNRYFAGN